MEKMSKIKISWRVQADNNDSSLIVQLEISKVKVRCLCMAGSVPMVLCHCCNSLSPALDTSP